MIHRCESRLGNQTIRKERGKKFTLFSKMSHKNILLVNSGCIFLQSTVYQTPLTFLLFVQRDKDFGVMYEVFAILLLLATGPISVSQHTEEASALIP